MSAGDAENLLIETTPLARAPEYYEMRDSIETMLVA
jgi:hypothetical protein